MSWESARRRATKRPGPDGTGRRLISGALGLAAAITLPAVPAAAQGPPGGSVSVTQEANLTFGQVVGGTTGVVLYTDAGAARFRVNAPRNTQVAVTFTLPSVLASGGNTVPLTFGPGSAAWRMQNDPSNATSFDPQPGTVVTVPGNGRFYVWIGSSVSPPLSQAAGIYTGTLTLTVTQN